MGSILKNYKADLQATQNMIDLDFSFEKLSDVIEFDKNSYPLVCPKKMDTTGKYDILLKKKYEYLFDKIIEFEKDLTENKKIELKTRENFYELGKSSEFKSDFLKQFMGSKLKTFDFLGKKVFCFLVEDFYFTKLWKYKKRKVANYTDILFLIFVNQKGDKLVLDNSNFFNVIAVAPFRTYSVEKNHIEYRRNPEKGYADFYQIFLIGSIASIAHPGTNIFDIPGNLLIPVGMDIHSVNVHFLRKKAEELKEKYGPNLDETIYTVPRFVHVVYSKKTGNYIVQHLVLRSESINLNYNNSFSYGKEEYYGIGSQKVSLNFVSNLIWRKFSWNLNFAFEIGNPKSYYECFYYRDIVFKNINPFEMKIRNLREKDKIFLLMKLNSFVTV